VTYIDCESALIGVGHSPWSKREWTIHNGCLDANGVMVIRTRCRCEQDASNEPIIISLHIEGGRRER
jgi:hypothetical protein